MAHPSRRRDRRKDFEFFFGEAKTAFHVIAEGDERSRSHRDLYGFYVSPGGRHGGDDKNAVEAFFGSRPYDAIEERVTDGQGRPAQRRRFLSAFGATLSYQCMANGAVLCMLHPAGAEGFHRRESGIVLSWIREPHALTGRGTLERHWRSLVSYMEYTSLDGDPTWGDRLRVWWLLASRGQIVDGKYEAPWGLSKLSLAAFFIFAVGLSGWLLAIVQWLLSGDQKPPCP